VVLLQLQLLSLFPVVNHEEQEESEGDAKSAARCAPTPKQQEQEKNPSRSGVRGRKRRANRDYWREADDWRGWMPTGKQRIAVAVVASTPPHRWLPAPSLGFTSDCSRG
jgi:hypothetical protein